MFNVNKKREIKSFEIKKDLQQNNLLEISINNIIKKYNNNNFKLNFKERNIFSFSLLINKHIETFLLFRDLWVITVIPFLILSFFTNYFTNLFYPTMLTFFSCFLISASLFASKLHKENNISEDKLIICLKKLSFIANNYHEKNNTKNLNTIKLLNKEINEKIILDKNTLYLKLQEIIKSIDKYEKEKTSTNYFKKLYKNIFDK